MYRRGNDIKFDASELLKHHLFKERYPGIEAYLRAREELEYICELYEREALELLAKSWVYKVQPITKAKLKYYPPTFWYTEDEAETERLNAEYDTGWEFEIVKFKNTDI